MLSLNYLPSNDRKRLIDINQKLLASLSSEEHAKLRQEQLDINAHVKPMSECDIKELQDFKQQVWEQLEKCRAIGSNQVHYLVNQIKQIEFREWALQQEEKKKAKVEETKKVDDEQQKSKSKVSSKSNSYSWTVNLD